MTSAAGDIEVFEPARFESLYDVIHTVATVPDACVSDWYLDVERSRKALMRLGKVCGPSEAERRDISKGVIVLDGRPQSLNADFVAQTLLLADELKVSEKYAASLLQEGIAAQARWGRAPTDVACLLHYRERLALLACIKELARGTYTLCVGGDLRAGVRMGRLLDDVVQDGTLVRNALAELDALDAERARVQTSMQSAAKAGARLSDDVQLERLVWLSHAEQELGHVLYLLALARRISPSALEDVMTHLSKSAVRAQRTPTVCVYLMTAVLAALDTVPDEAGEWLAQHSAASLCTAEALRGDARCLAALWRIAADGAWTTPGLQHVVQLQLALFLTDALSAHTSLAPALGHSLDDVQALAMRAVTADSDASALLFLLLRVLSFRRTSDDDVVDVDDAPIVLDAEFQEYVLQQVTHLVLGVTTTCFPLLRRLQRAEEDAAIASIRTARPGSQGAAPRRYDIEALFDLIALVCRGRPESGAPFWHGHDRRTSRFLLWAVDARETGQQRALLNMLAALAEGPQCALNVHALLEHDAGAPANERRVVTWTHLFDWMAHYVDAFQRHASAAMPPDEMVLLRGFLGVLATVVRWSAATRDALFAHKAYVPLDRLFALYACAVPMDLKAALLHALAAFAAHPDTGAGARILSALWERLDASGAVRAVRPGEAPRAISDLEHIESVHGRYPATHALVDLLCAVLPHAVRTAPEAQAHALVASVHAHAPLQLDTRKPLVHAARYVAFVLDDVLVPASSRTYARPAERWALCAACLRCAEQCVAALPTPLDTAHPGFDVLRRVLSGAPLLRELFFFVHPDSSCAGFEVVNEDRAQTPDFAAAVRAALSMLVQVLGVQDEALRTSTTRDAAWRDRPLLPLDTHLLHAHDVVIQLALYVNCTDAAIALLAVRLLSALARTSTFQATDAFGPLKARASRNRLVGLLDMAGEAARVTAGVHAWLTIHDDAECASIQAALLDLFLDQMAPDAPAPNIAHLLLGYDVGAEAHPADRLVGAQDMVLRTLVRRLAPPRTWAPALAERAYAVVHRACIQPYTSASTLRFLRTHDFVAAQLQALPAVMPASDSDGDSIDNGGGAGAGALVYATGEAVRTSAENALALLHTHAHVVSLVALELHTLATHDQLARAMPLLTLLIGEPAVHERGGATGRWRALLDATHVRWDDAYDADPRMAAKLEAARIRGDSLGAGATRMYDIAAVAALLVDERGQQEHAAWLEHARRALLWAAAQNTRRAVAHACQEACRAWRQVLDVLVCDHALSAVRPDLRLAFFLDATDALLTRLEAADGTAVPSIAASAVLSLLRAIRVQVRTSGDGDVGAVAAERLVHAARAMLRALCVGGATSSAPMRYDLYLSVVCAVELVTRTPSAMAARMRTVLASHADALVHVVARDALDGSDVLQTVALTLLSHLVAWDASAGGEPAGMHVAHRLASGGYLKSLAMRVQELDGPLQATLAPDPPSLNALYVYEALLAVFMRIAQSPAAGLLVDARLLDVLVRVDFPSLRPEHTLDDADGFLPPVAERYASLLAPLLHVVVGVLTSLPHARDGVHALLSAHQDAWLATMHAATHSAPGIGDVEQAALLVHILTLVAPPAPPAPFHAATLALAAAYLAPNAHELLRPLTPTEREDASVLAATYNGLVQTAPDARLTVFDAAARRAVDRLVRALVQYMEHASSAGDARAILVPSMHVARASDHASPAARVVAAPSLGVAIAALGEQCTSLSLALTSLERVDTCRHDPSAAHADEWTDMALEAGLAPPTASPAQCRAACIDALGRVARDLTASVETKLDVVERMLVLLVRHLDMFCSAGIAQQPDALRASAHAALTPILDERVAYLSLPTSVVPSADEHLTLLHMSARRIAEILLGAPATSS